MSSTTSRRAFLTAASAGTAAALLAPRRAPAIEPIRRPGTPNFVFSLAAYSYRELLQKKEGGMSLSEFVHDAAAMGLDGVELTSYYFPTPVMPAYLRNLKGECFRLGLDVSGTAVGNDFGLAEGPARRQAIDHVKQWVEYAEMLGAPVIRIFAGHVPRGDDPAAARRRMIEAMEECCEYAGQYGIHLALENHGGPTSTAEGMLEFVRAVQSPWFGVNLDTGNFHTEDVYGDLAQLAPYTINVQVKVVISRPGRGKEPTDFPRLAQILRDANYRGYIVLEYEEPGDPREECPRYVAQLREAFT
jgi:sugar phosphate isomerase/epimerase